jgi:hypothetical protein
MPDARVIDRVDLLATFCNCSVSTDPDLKAHLTTSLVDNPVLIFDGTSSRIHFSKRTPSKHSGSCFDQGECEMANNRDIQSSFVVDDRFSFLPWAFDISL